VIGGEMHEGVRLLDRRQQLLAVVDVSDDGFETLSQKIKAGGKIIVDEDFVACPSQHPRRLTSDVPGASYYQNLQLSPPGSHDSTERSIFIKSTNRNFDWDRSSLSASHAPLIGISKISDGKKLVKH
jgi:hypothetical protein